MTGFAPLAYRGLRSRALTVPELMQRMLNAKNTMGAAVLRHGDFLAATSLFRSWMSTEKVDEQLLNAQNRNSFFFVEWIPN